MRIPAILCLAAVAAATLSAQTAAPAPKKPVFANPDRLVVANFLPDPPAPGSKQEKAELAELHRLQDTRTQAQVVAAKADDGEEDIFIFKTVLGARFNREALPLTAALSDHLHNDEGVIVNPAKTFFHRIRPYNADATLKPVCAVKANPADYAYPSDPQASRIVATAMIAQMLTNPKFQDELAAAAKELRAALDLALSPAATRN